MRSRLFSTLLVCLGVFLSNGCSKYSSDFVGQECASDDDCPGGYHCDPATDRCKKDCVPGCTGKCCGSDGCGGTCTDDCSRGDVCNPATCKCEAELNCQTNDDCPENYWCDRTVWRCRPIDCIPNCTGKCCGDDGCAGTCPNNCPVGYECNMTSCLCDNIDCCTDAPAGEFHIDVAGTVVDVTNNQGVKVAVAPISPMDALTNPVPTHLDEQVSGTDGSFQTDCFDVTTVALGCVMFVDDQGFDGNTGSYFPTGTGVAAWERNADKVCVYEAKAFAVPTSLVAALDATTSVDSASYGFVIGFVMDASFNQIEGAVVKMGDGTDLVEVIYPNATFTDFSGTATAATGIFVLPHTNFATGLIDITAEKAGMTFELTIAAPKTGFCYFVVIQEES